MLSEKIIKELQEILGKDNVLTSKAERIVGVTDALLFAGQDVVFTKDLLKFLYDFF